MHTFSTRNQANLTRYQITTALALVIALTAGLAQAKRSTADAHTTALHCGATSPLLHALGDDYYALDGQESPDTRARFETPITSEQHQLLDALLTWRFSTGHGQRTRCFGVGQNSRAETSELVLEQVESRAELIGQRSRDAELPSAIVLAVMEYTPHDRTVRAQSISVPLNEYQLQLTSEHQLSSNARFRHVVGGIVTQSRPFILSSRMNEHSLTATQTRTGIRLEHALYVNGTLAEWVTWFLIR